MAITVTLPADTKVPGNGSHTTDHNTIVDAVQTLANDAANTAGDTFTGTVTFSDTATIGSTGYTGKDAISYGPMGRKKIFASDNIAIATQSYVALTGMSMPLGIGTYGFVIKIHMKANTNNGQWSVELTGPATSSLHYGFQYVSAAGVTALNSNVTGFSSNLSGPATSVTGFYWITIEGQLTTTATGNLVVLGKDSGTAGTDTWNYFAPSYIEISEQ